MSTAQVWKLVAEKEGKHTLGQLSDKWKALKRIFSSGMEKQGDKNTGGEAGKKWKFLMDFSTCLKMTQSTVLFPLHQAEKALLIWMFTKKLNI